VKPDSADGTAIACGRVGSRRLVLRKPSRKFPFSFEGFFVFYICRPAPRLCLYCPSIPTFIEGIFGP
ncbi:MAG: hypothetical protein WAP46_04795, partial [Dysgonamonadaceae bacterium]